MIDEETFLQIWREQERNDPELFAKDLEEESPEQNFWEQMIKLEEQDPEAEDEEEDEYDPWREEEERENDLEILKRVAFQYLQDNPGTEDDWGQGLIEAYGREVVDAFGCDPFDVWADLSDLWESAYYDEQSGIEMDFSEWAEFFCTESAVQVYKSFVTQLSRLRDGALLEDLFFRYMRSGRYDDPEVYEEFLYEHIDAVVEAFGTDPHKAYQGILKLRESSYRDPNSGVEMTFEEWSDFFGRGENLYIYESLESELE